MPAPAVAREGLLYLQDPSEVLDPLDVTSEQEHALDPTREKRGRGCGSASTQVSFEPPPWLELTITEPFSRATRERPPGSTQVDRPVTAKGRRSTWRGSIPFSVSIGVTESATIGWAM